MNLTRITITGADDKITPEELVKLSAIFPNVEWGILFSPSRVSTSRYPRLSYAREVAEIAKESNVDINLSGHICGQWTRDFFQNNFSFQKQFPELFNVFKRIQLNFNSTKHPYDTKCFDIIKSFPEKQFIFQLNKSNQNLCAEAKKELSNIAFLYDSSGGRGTLAKEWNPPVTGFYTGYAGGLTPDNLIDNLVEIEEVAEDTEIWIDIESGVRTEKDDLDMDLVLKYITLAYSYDTKQEAEEEEA